MTVTPPPNHPIQLEIGREAALMLSNASLGLFGLYIVAVLADAVPIKLLDPLWLLTLAAALGNGISIPLAGLAFLHVASFIAPDIKNIESRRITCSRLARFAVIGFLLLLPLIGFANLRGIRNVAIGNQRDLAVISNRAKEISSQIQLAASPLDLQARMAKLQGPTIPNSQLSRPLGELKQESLKVVQSMSAGYKNQVKGPFSEEFIPIYKQSLRSMAMALLGAFSFAAMAWNPLTNKSMLNAFSASFSKPARPNAILAAIGNKINGLINERKQYANKAELRSQLKSQKKDAERQALIRKRDVQRTLEAQRKEAAARERKRLKEQQEEQKRRNR